MDLISAGARKLDGIEDGREDIAITEGGSWVRKCFHHWEEWRQPCGSLRCFREYVLFRLSSILNASVRLSLLVSSWVIWSSASWSPESNRQHFDGTLCIECSPYSTPMCCKLQWHVFIMSQTAVAKALRDVARKKALAEEAAAVWKRKYEMERGRNDRLERLTAGHAALGLWGLPSLLPCFGMFLHMLLELSLQSMRLLIEGLSPMIFYWLFCIQNQ